MKDRVTIEELEYDLNQIKDECFEKDPDDLREDDFNRQEREDKG